MDIRAELRRYIGAELLGMRGADSLADGTDLLQNGLDSLGVLRLTVFLEDRFGVKVPDEAVVPENIRTVEALAALVTSLRSGT